MTAFDAGAMPLVAGGSVVESFRARPAHFAVLRFLLVNIVGFALLGAAAVQGWVGQVLAADGTGLSLAIFALFLAGLVFAGAKIWIFTRELSCVYGFDPCHKSLASMYFAEVAGRTAGSRAMTGSALRLTVGNGIAPLRQVANTLVLMGLIGTVVGFIIALAGVDPTQAGDVTAIAPMVADLIRGMSVALFTTLVGAVLNVWLMVNYRLLTDAAVTLTTAIVRLGEANERPRPV